MSDPDQPYQPLVPRPALKYDSELSDLVGSLNRSATTALPSGPSLDLAPIVVTGHRTSPTPALSKILEEAVERSASDVLLVVDSPPVIRVDGQLVRLDQETLTGPAIRELVLPVLDRERRATLVAKRFCDFAFDVAGIGRFRANIHFERARLGACFRALPRTIPALTDLGLPKEVLALAELQSGLILVAGPAGCGKTTTLASLLATISARRSIHAITMEEPVEYLHEHHASVVEQVEIPRDCPTFAEAIRSALRQSPDVLLVGEMRDGETMAAALTAAETGHLVLASVHAHTASQALHRVLDAFPANQQDQVQRQLSLTLGAIVSQRLVAMEGRRGRTPIVELIRATDAVRNLIREGRMHQLSQVVTSSRSGGMVSLEASLAEAVKDGRLSLEVAMRHAFYPEELRHFLA